jgi:hypothetical protein
MYSTLVITGIGSAALHATLHWVFQSADELPMLWVVWSLLYCLALSPKGVTEKSYPGLGYIVLGINIVQTFVYYKFQSLYPAFLGSFALLVLSVWYFSSKLMAENVSTSEKKMRWSLWQYMTFSFLFGFAVWLIDMNMCDTLLLYYLGHPFIATLGPMTLHVLWHIFAAYGGFCAMTGAVCAGLQNTDNHVKIGWVLGMPVCRIDGARVKDE